MQTRFNLLPEAPPALFNPALLNVGSGITSAEQIEQMREKLLLENTFHLHASHATCGLALIATAVSMQYLYQHQPAFIAEWMAQEAVQNGTFEHQTMLLSQSAGYQQMTFTESLSLPSPLVDAQEGSDMGMAVNMADLPSAIADEPTMLNDAGISEASAGVLPVTTTAESADDIEDADDVDDVDDVENVKTAFEALAAEVVDFTLDAGNHPLIQGMAPADSQIEIYINDQLVGVSESNAAGLWTWRHKEGLPNGNYQFQSVTIDSQGQRLSLENPLNFTIDVAENSSGLWIEELLRPVSEMDFNLLFLQEGTVASEEITLQILPEADDIWIDLLPSGLTIKPISSGITESNLWHPEPDLLLH